MDSPVIGIAAARTNAKTARVYHHICPFEDPLSLADMHVAVAGGTINDSVTAQRMSKTPAQESVCAHDRDLRLDRFLNLRVCKY